MKVCLKPVSSPFGPHEIFSVSENQGKFFSVISHEMSGHIEFTLKVKREVVCVLVVFAHELLFFNVALLMSLWPRV